MDYVKFVCVKGLLLVCVVLMYVLCNMFILLVIVVGLEFGFIIVFVVVIESIFVWFGVGKLILDSINVLDCLVIVVYLMVIVCMFVIINLVVDVFYKLLDLCVWVEVCV